MSTPSTLPGAAARAASRVDWPRAAADVEHAVARAHAGGRAQPLVVTAQLVVVVVDEPQPRPTAPAGLLEEVGQLDRAAQRHTVAGGDLVGHDAEALGHHAAHEGGREEAILGAQDEAGRHVRQGVERPRRRHRGLRRVRALLAHRQRGQLARHVVVVADVRVVAAGQPAVARGLLLDRLPVSGPLPPVARRLARGRDHAGHEHQGIDREPGGDQRRGEPAERLSRRRPGPSGRRRRRPPRRRSPRARASRRRQAGRAPPRRARARAARPRPGASTSRRRRRRGSERRCSCRPCIYLTHEILAPSEKVVPRGAPDDSRCCLSGAGEERDSVHAAAPEHRRRDRHG